ncbi:uncharacterized protein LOC125229903 [Leguminivora glycinivorella]|uniref:uncharacterized protein LOC125229903 n=1 Tax=Leguminivora glycinivorella TaxID=1035111 RepID=UPI00200BE352|nr:uncharacterized protein LOC125229903 [Leguminivora glycinivorella]
MFKLLFTLCSVFFFGDASFVGSLTKCSINDSLCQKKLYQSLIRHIGKSGVEELGIPPVDPLELKNVSVAIVGMLDISLEHGIVRGAKDCLLNNVTTDLPNGHLYMDMTCDFTVKGHYKAFSSSPLIKSVLGGEFVRADGVGKVRVEKLHLKLDFAIYAHKDDDGEIYLTSKYDETKYDFEILGKLVFAANNIFMEEQDISALAVSLLNQAGKSMAPYFGRAFMDKALEYVYAFCGRFFEVVPARYYIKDDLTPFLSQ